MVKKVLLIDSFGLLFRSYFALEKTGLATKDGTYTFAIYGFFKAFFKAVQQIEPTHIILALESKTSRRKELDPNYKANRTEQPQALLDQIVLFHNILEKTALPSLRIEGYEADDVLATLTSFFKEEQNTEVYIYSSDKDLAQLVSDKVYIIQPSKTIAQPLSILDKQGVFDKFSVTPAQIVDYLSMIGDVSDNVKGIDGVGPKTAAQLLLEYGSLEQVYHNIGELKSKLQEKFKKSYEQVILAKKLVTLHTDTSICRQENLGEITSKQIQALVAIFKELEFAPFKELQLLQQLTVFDDSTDGTLSLFSSEGDLKQESSTLDSIITIPKEYKVILKKEELPGIIEDILKLGFVAFDTETTGLNIEEDILLGISLSWMPHQGVYIALAQNTNSSEIDMNTFVHYFSRIFESSYVNKIGHNIKFDYKVLSKIFPNMDGFYFDTMLAAYLINPDSKKYGLDFLSLEYCNYQKIEYKSLVDGKIHKNLSTVELSKTYKYACEDTDLTLQLYFKLKEILKEYELEDTFFSIEMPLIKIIGDMELLGIGVDVLFFQNLQGQFEVKIKSIAEEIYNLAGEQFNINSPKQVSSILYEKLKLPKPKSAGKSKSVFATDEESLQKLSEFGIINRLLEYRKYHKLLSTYIIPIIEKSVSNNSGEILRIHSNFQQTGTATGRLSSTDPNLQNIPVKDETGKLIRTGFIASEGNIFIGLDYSQIELRLMAHFSQDETLTQAFINGDDIHIATASKIFNKSALTITPQERNIAKTINFGIIYGMGSLKLAKEINISNQEAKDFISTYFDLFEGVKNFISETKQQAHEKQYVTTLLGRKRFLTDINSTNTMFVAMNERMAVNTIIQGSNADIMKQCMIQLEEQGILKEAKLLLQIHDELIFEVSENKSETIGRKIQHIMENISILRVPLKASLNFGHNWGSLK